MGTAIALVDGAIGAPRPEVGRKRFAVVRDADQGMFAAARAVLRVRVPAGYGNREHHEQASHGSSIGARRAWTLALPAVSRRATDGRFAEPVRGESADRNAGKTHATGDQARNYAAYLPPCSRFIP